MPEGESKAKYGYLVALLTHGLAIATFYCTAVQTHIGSRNLDLSLNLAASKLEGQISELITQIKERKKDNELAEVLGQVGALQEQIASLQEKFPEQRGEKEIAAMQQKLSDVQKDVARLQQDRDRKAKEIDTLHGQVAQLEKDKAQLQVAKANTELTQFLRHDASHNLGRLPALSEFTPPSPLPAAGLVTRPALTLNGPQPGNTDALKQFLTLNPAPRFPPVNLTAATAPPPSPSSVGELLAALWEVVRKSPRVSIYFGVALVFLLGKLFGSR